MQLHWLTQSITREPDASSIASPQAAAGFGVNDSSLLPTQDDETLGLQAVLLAYIAKRYPHKVL